MQIYFFLFHKSIPVRSSHQEVFCKKGVGIFLVKMLEKYLWRSLFFVKLQALKSTT